MHAIHFPYGLSIRKDASIPLYKYRGILLLTLLRAPEQRFGSIDAWVRTAQTLSVHLGTPHTYWDIYMAVRRWRMRHYSGLVVTARAGRCLEVSITDVGIDLVRYARDGKIIVLGLTEWLPAFDRLGQFDQHAC